MKMILRYYIGTSVDLPVDADSIEDALRIAREDRTLAKVFEQIAISREDVVDAQVAVDSANGTIMSDEYYDVEGF